MSKKVNCLCIIPARGGSKRIKKKNIKLFCGKPMISYAINSAIKSKCFDKILVSTDSLKIAKIAKKYKAYVPFLRSKNLSGDNVPIAPVIHNVLAELRKIKIKPQIICVLTATSPLLSFKHLIKSKNFFIKNRCKFLVSVNKYDYPIQRALKINNNKKLKMIDGKNSFKRSQDLKTHYHDAGQFYWGRANSFNKKSKILTDNSRPYLLKKFESIDIDTSEDWEQAKLLFKLQNFKKKNKIL